MAPDPRAYLTSMIATYPADVEKEEAYQEKIHQYKDNRYTYIPLISDGKYYNTEKGWLRNLDNEQFIWEGEPLIEAIKRLNNFPFLLVRYTGNRTYLVKDGEFLGHKTAMKYLSGDKPNVSDENEYKLEEMFQKFPDMTQEKIPHEYGESFGIITLADLNKRSVKEMLYPNLAELANHLSEKIKDEYPNSEDLFPHINPDTIGLWKQDRLNGLEMHISEYLNLVEMKEIIRMTGDDFIEECGFSSRNQLDEKLGSINSLRNKVMHANRTLVQNRQDLQNLIKKYQVLREILEEKDKN